MQLSNIAGLLVVYAGFCLCLAECVWEPELLRRPYQLQVALIGIVFSLMVVFTIFVVGVSASLGLYASGSSADYPEMPIGDISWRGNYYPLKLTITNTSEYDYDKLDLIIKPDKPITKITQVSGFCQLHFEDAVKMSQEMQVISPSGRALALSPVLIATDGGYRVRCDTLPSKSSVEIVAALVTIDEMRPKKKPTNLIEDVTRIPRSNGVNHWFTDKRNPWIATGDLFLEKPVPNFVWVYGTYKCLNRARGITEKLSVSDPTGEFMKTLQQKGHQ